MLYCTFAFHMRASASVHLCIFTVHCLLQLAFLACFYLFATLLRCNLSCKMVNFHTFIWQFHDMKSNYFVQFFFFISRILSLTYGWCKGCKRLKGMSCMFEWTSFLWSNLSWNWTNGPSADTLNWLWCARPAETAEFIVNIDLWKLLLIKISLYICDICVSFSELKGPEGDVYFCKSLYIICIFNVIQIILNFIRYVCISSSCIISCTKMICKGTIVIGPNIYIYHVCK